jgi:hypothetical protein
LGPFGEKGGGFFIEKSNARLGLCDKWGEMTSRLAEFAVRASAPFGKLVKLYDNNTKLDFWKIF